MKVTDLHVDGFGIWTDLQLSGLSNRVTILYGANEAGKTTLMQFMRSVLYGFSPERRSRYLPPVHGGQPGGALDVDTNRGQLRILRHLEQLSADQEVEQVAVHSQEGGILSSALLGELLSDVDEPTFTNVFAVGLRELQELGTLDDTSAADLLYKLTTGLDRVSLVDVMRQLDGSRHALLDPRSGSGRIVDLHVHCEELRARVDDLVQSGCQWVDLQSRMATLDQEARDLESRLSDLGATLQIVDVAEQVRELWSQRRVLSRQLEAFGPVSEVSASVLRQLEPLGQEIEHGETQIAQLRRRRRAIHLEASQQPVNQTLWTQAARIEALAEHAPWIASLQSQIKQLRAEIQETESKLVSTSDRLGLHEEIATDDLPDISRRTLAALRAPARAVREETQRLKQAQQEVEAARLQLDDLTVELETALLDHGYDNLGTAVEEKGSLVNRLRRRIQLEGRLDEMARQTKDLQRDHRVLLEEQVLSLTTLAWLGVPFVIGVMLVLGGLIWSSAAMLGWPVAILGLAGWSIAVIAKISMERSAARELAQCEKQLRLLQGETVQSVKEREGLDALLPRGTQPHEARLATAERELAGLEELLPVEANIQTVRQRAHAAQRRLDQLTSAASEARSRWCSALRRVDLPATLSPQTVRQLAEGNEQASFSRRQLHHRREELSARERELTSLTLRIEELMQQVNVSCVSDDPQEQITMLSRAVVQQQTLFERRRELRQEDRQIKREGRKLVKQLRKTSVQRRAIVARAGVKSEHELRQLIARHEQRCLLEQELQEANAQFEAALGQRFSLDQVERELVDYSDAELEQRRTHLMHEVEEGQTRLAKVHQQRGAVAQELKTLVADRRGAEARLELECVEQQLREAVDRWRVLAVTAHVLETVRAIYETHRQPQTLKDASRYFDALTGGQYSRIWTPLTDTSLRVDLASGESLALDILSCGTREAVYLSLRLALVADFARRGVVLPLVLDDVLVNFDRQRASAAARVLCQFAEAGHQVLLFTCHEHIVCLFEAADVEIRYLTPYAELENEAADDPGELEPVALPAQVDETAGEVDEDDDVEELCDEYEVEDAEEDEDEGEGEECEEDLYDDTEYELEDEQGDVRQEDDVDYALEPEEPIEESVEFIEFEELADLDEAEDDADEGPEYDDETADVQEEVDETPIDEPMTEQPQQRFAWESPERWWEPNTNGGAAA